MTPEWSIQGRADRCAATQTPFTEGETFHALLFPEGAGFRREDWSAAAFQARPADAPQPFSMWRGKFTPPPPPAPEPLGKGTAEELLRRTMEDAAPEHANLRYILALMLERKRVLKPVDRQTGEDGGALLVYEHGKTGEVFIIPDPQLRLDQVAAVQAQVAGLLR